MIPKSCEKYLLVGCLVDFRDMSISRDGEVFRFKFKVFELLKLFIHKDNGVVSSADAIRCIWEGNDSVGKRGLSTAIWNLRKGFATLVPDAEDLFVTIPKVGYQLTAKPTPVVEKNKSDEIEVASEEKEKSAVDVAVFANKLYWILGPVIILFSLLLYSSQHGARVLTVEEEYSLTPKHRDTYYEGVEEQVDISPDGQKMAFVWKKSGQEALVYVKSLIDVDLPPVAISRSEMSQSSPEWSPDGESIAYFSYNSTGYCALHVISLVSNEDKVLAHDCVGANFYKNISWSPDGSKIAYAAKLGDVFYVKYYDHASAEFHVATTPGSGEKDMLPVWMDSQTLSYVRSGYESGIKSVDIVSGLVGDLVGGLDVVLGVAFNKDAGTLYFNANDGGDYVVHSYQISTGEVEKLIRRDSIHSLDYDAVSNRIFYSQHISQEYVVRLGSPEGDEIERIASSYRDMYGELIRATGELLFVSNRSGNWELWVKGRGGSRMLSNNVGHIMLPSVSPTKPEFVLPLQVADGGLFEMYICSLSDGVYRKLFDISSDVRHPSYSQNGELIYFISNKRGKWAVYSYSFEDGAVTFIFEAFARNIADNYGKGLYFSVDGESGIYYFDFSTKTIDKKVDGLSQNDWGGFFLDSDKRLVYVKREKTKDLIVKVDPRGFEIVLASFPPTTVRNGRSLMPDHSGGVIVSHSGINGSDIYSFPLRQ